jgi:hypothetical protein
VFALLLMLVDQCPYPNMTGTLPSTDHAQTASQCGSVLCTPHDVRCRFMHCERAIFPNRNDKY